MLVQFVLPFNLVCHHLMSFLLSIIQYRYFSCAFSTISLIYFLNNIWFNFLSNFVSIFLLTFFPSKVPFFFIFTLYPYFLKLPFLQSSSNLFHLLILFVITICHFFLSTIRHHHFSWPFSTIFLFLFFE